VAIITLTSDIGLQDYLTGAIKGLLAQNCPDHRVIDISHEILPFNFPQAAYLCKSALKWFPRKTCHFILVNLFDHKNTHYLLCEHQGQYFFSADNGLITMILDGKPEVISRLEMPPVGNNTLAVISGFAEAVLALEYGTPVSEIGHPVDTLVERNPLQPIVQNTYIEGQVIYIDRFENVVVNITREQFEASRKGRGFRISVMRDEFISQISESYADAPEGEKVAMFNTSGYLEIAINKGNAAGLFGLESYSKDAASYRSVKDNQFQKQLFYQTIRVHFED
jgi:S-adenosylmethionine hydrolase